MKTDLWILVFATHPDTATDLFHDQAQALTDSALRQIYLDYDRAHDLDTRDPRLDDLARRIVAATKSRYGPLGYGAWSGGGPPDPAASEMADTERSSR